MINGLTDLLHPCQILADLLTVRQTPRRLEGKAVAWIGDGNNMANSLDQRRRTARLRAAARVPRGLRAEPRASSSARKTTKVTITRDPREAAEGAHVVNTDVWASMGQEEEQEQRERAFQGYTVDRALMETADKGAIFLHCLPAHRGEEVAAEVIEGPQTGCGTRPRTGCTSRRRSWRHS